MKTNALEEPSVIDHDLYFLSRTLSFMIIYYFNYFRYLRQIEFQNQMISLSLELGNFNYRLLFLSSFALTSKREMCTNNQK